MSAHDSRIAAGHAWLSISHMCRMSGRAWRFAVSVISLPPGRPTALLLMPDGFISRGYGRAAFR
jgi:hypothetical protein